MSESLPVNQPRARRDTTLVFCTTANRPFTQSALAMGSSQVDAPQMATSTSLNSGTKDSAPALRRIKLEVKSVTLADVGLFTSTFIRTFRHDQASYWVR